MTGDDRRREDDVAHLLVETGVSLGRCSYPAPQSEELVAQVAAAFHSTAEVAVLPTLVIAEDRRLRTVAMERIGSAFRFDQIAAVQRAINRARFGKVGVGTALQELRAVPFEQPAHPTWLRIVGYALCAVGFALYLRLSLPAVVAALGLGVLVGAALIATSRSPHLTALMPVLATFCCALVVTVGAGALGVPVPVRLAAVPVLMLLPGAVLTAAVVELVSGDMISGASRMIYAVMILVAMAVSFSLAVQVADVAGTHLIDLTEHDAPVWALWLGIGLFAVGTPLYMCTPRAFWVPGILVVYGACLVQALASQVVSSSLAAGVATALALLVSWGYNYRQGGGPAALLVYLPAFWLMVPGSAGFVAVTGIMDSDSALASLGKQTGLTIISMAIGMMVAVLAAPMLVKVKHLSRHSPPA